MVQRGLACGGRRGWLRPLIGRILAAFPAPHGWRTWEPLTTFIHGDPGFRAGLARGGRDRLYPIRQWFAVQSMMAPAAGAPAGWAVPALATAAALADWLGLKPTELEWFADRRGREADVPPGPLRHYSYHWLPKARGHWRLVEAPKARRRCLQRRLLHEILDLMPPHAAAHGYCRGRSITTFAAPHCRQRVVLRFDLRDFFSSVPASRVHVLFTTAGYPPSVASLLTALCTNVVPMDATAQTPDGRPVPWAERRKLASPHLPQGAPPSPALANLCAFGLDRRLQALAAAAGSVYTRYADDLAFSGGEELRRSARRFQVAVCRIALEEGFEINTRKSRLMGQGVRQQLVGVVVNDHPNLRRADYDRLKATLHQCVRDGPASQNRDGHGDFRAYLRGRVAHVTSLNPVRGRKLQALFERIWWDEAGDPGEQAKPG